MGLTLVLKAHNIIIHSLCKYIKYNNLCINLDHYFYDMCPCCTHLVAHTTVWLKNNTIPNL